MEQSQVSPETTRDIKQMTHALHKTLKTTSAHKDDGTTQPNHLGLEAAPGKKL